MSEPVKEIIKTGYKVVYRGYKTCLTSVIMQFMESRVAYHINGWAYPRNNCGPLCVFTRMADAEAFANGHNGKVYKCLFIKSSYDEAWYVDSEGFRLLLPLHSMQNSYGDSCVLAERVMLVEDNICYDPWPTPEEALSGGG